jgi:hypothetical protein
VPRQRDVGVLPVSVHVLARRAQVKALSPASRLGDFQGGDRRSAPQGRDRWLCRHPDHVLTTELVEGPRTTRITRASGEHSVNAAATAVIVGARWSRASAELPVDARIAIRFQGRASRASYGSCRSAVRCALEATGRPMACAMLTARRGGMPDEE